jgi:hypothetical protein
MRPTLFLSLAMAPLLSVTLAAPSTLDTRAISCPTNPCASYVGLLNYCAKSYNNLFTIGGPIGEAALICVCGAGGEAAIGQWDSTTVDEVILWTNQCSSCEQINEDELTLLTRWQSSCNTLLIVGGVQEALECFNENKYCVPVLEAGKRARI